MTRPPVVGVLLLTVLCALTVSAQPQRESFPNTVDRGRAAVEFDDGALQVVAAYYHSQRRHDSRWLLIEIAVSSRRPTRITRDGLVLITPDDRLVPLAAQSAFAQDLPRIRSLLLQAETTRHGIVGYFKKRRLRNFRFFALPFQGVVHEVFDVDQWQIGWGDLFFSSPTGAWAPGTYTLVVEGSAEMRATLPIDLD